MASGLSRSCFGLLHAQSTSMGASSSRLLRCSVAVRNYSGGSASVVKTRGPPSAKSAHRNEALGSGATSKVSAKASMRTSPKDTLEPAKAVRHVPNAKKTPTPPTTKASSPSSFVPNKIQNALHPGKGGGEKGISEEELQLKQIDQILLMSHLMPTSDPWGQPVPDTLDVMIPQPASFSSRKEYGSWAKLRQQFWKNRTNDAKNVVALLALAAENGIPGVDLEDATLWQKATVWPRRVFDTQSVKPNSWVSQIRTSARRAYIRVNEAIARRDDKAVKRLTTATYQETALKLLKKKVEGITYIWRYHSEVTPTRIVSIRTTEGYLGKEEPKVGNRLLVHALVKFDTMQSLEMYNKNGRPMHVPREGAKKDHNGHIAAEPKRVTEYMVVEKRMWYDGSWVIREQMWPPRNAVSSNLPLSSPATPSAPTPPTTDATVA
ncbi:hypothetical protein BDQ12DRAFT_121149 [Crucibulum laeve]|uniref:Tim44-like domain-containing protein n=1 Tax=Crucibulum laeve TaxID=68775 RepID=A0A5C3LZ12_9AGAR|nr:hypothetical protein BDQ12DRAFT_121149 [Crucibulum laeve]